MPAIVRRTSTKVVDGRVSRKSRSDLSEVDGYAMKKFPAGKGFKHVVSVRQLQEFLTIIPDWPDLSHRLSGIILTRGYENAFGYHEFYRREKVAVIALCPWPKQLWTPLNLWFFRQHRPIFEALGVPARIGLTEVTCRFTVAQARAFSLLHVFMHEVGHHQDWLHRRGRGLTGKEHFAEEFANRHFGELLPLYCERFGQPSTALDDEATLEESKMRRVI